MMRNLSSVLCWLAIGLALAVAACAPALPEPEVALPSLAPGSPEARAQLALQLAAQARRDQDARAMLVAARLMLTSGTRPASIESGSLQAEVGADPVASGWAQEALVFAGDTEALRAEAEAVLATRPRGVMRSSLGTGPLRYVQRLAARQSVRIAISTQPQSAARVAAIGDGDALIGLTVSTAGQTVCDQDTRRTHSVCSWYALADRHEVTLVNHGPLGSDVMLLSN